MGVLRILIAKVKGSDAPVRYYRDGVWWRSLTPPQQITYVLGHIDTIAVMQTAVIASLLAPIENASRDMVSAEEIRTAIDLFFKPKYRRAVSLSSAVYYVSRTLLYPDADHSELLTKLVGSREVLATPQAVLR